MSAELAVSKPAACDGMLLPLLVRLRESPAGGSGAWRLGNQGRDVGVVLMERGRVCWAAAMGRSRRLTDIIVDKHGLDPVVIERIYQGCRERGRPLGEGLVGEGLLTAESLELVLMQHTAEAIGHLARLGPDSVMWIPHSKQGYSPRFTFCLLTVFAHAQAVATGIDPAALQTRLEVMSGGALTLLAYSSRTGQDLPIAIACTEELDLDALLELGRWARSSLRALVKARTQPQVISASTHHGVFVAIDEGDVVIAALCRDGAALARFLGHRARGEHGHLRPQ